MTPDAAGGPPAPVGAGAAELAASVDPAVAALAVAAVPGGDAAMERDRLLLVDLIATHPDVARRTCFPGHLTGSALVVDVSRRATLLVLHRKLGRWLQPGGHADGDTNLAAVAWREATEETGIGGLLIELQPLDLDIHLVDPPDDRPHLHLDVRYLVLAPSGAVASHNEESLEARWVPLDDLDDYRPDAGLVRLAGAARRRLGWRSSASC